MVSFMKVKVECTVHMDLEQMRRLYALAIEEGHEDRIGGPRGRAAMIRKLLESRVMREVNPDSKR